MSEYPTDENLIKGAIVKHILKDCANILNNIISSSVKPILFSDIKEIYDVILIPSNTGEGVLAFITKFQIFEYAIEVQGMINTELKVEVTKVASLNHIIQKESHDIQRTSENLVHLGV